MGCDIHIVVEVRTNDSWTAIIEPVFAGDSYDQQRGEPFLIEPFGWRNYAMFTLFAGVRDYGEEGISPISEPRGLPDDAAAVTREELEWDDFHSRSWLSLAELVDIPQKVRDLAGLGEQFESQLTTLRSLGRMDDVRIVFAFDN